MASPVQTYKNHVRFLPAFHFFVIPILLLNALNAARHLLATPHRSTVLEFLVAAALLTLGFLSRVMALTVQDRVIRLEMRMRLQQCLPPDLRSKVNDLTSRQLVALRFASDAELPELVREVAAGRLKTAKEIKRRVRDWQGDFLRA